MGTSSKISEIWYTFCPVVCVSHIAQEMGWLEAEFAKDGIKLSHISTLPAKDGQSHFTHKHDRLIRDGGNIPPIWTRSEGVNTIVVGMVCADHGRAILVRKDSQITSIKELKGKRIALLRRLPDLIDFYRATAKRNIILSLKAHGLTEDDIQFVDIPIGTGSLATEKTPPQGDGWAIFSRTGWKLPQQPEMDALQSGEVDAMTADGSREVILEQTGVARSIYNLRNHPDWEYHVNINYPWVCTVSDDLAKNHPDLVTRWMKVLVKAGMWAKDNYAEVLKIFAKVTGRPEETLQKSYPLDFHKHLVPEVSERGIQALEVEKSFLKEHGFINNDFDVRSWVDGSFLEAAVKAVEAESK